MSNIVITGIVGVGQYAVPASDIELTLATAGLDALLGTIPNLVYNRVVAMVDNPEGPDGAVGARTLRCLIEEFVYDGDENPLPVVLNALAVAIEAKLESDPDISSVGQQYFSLFESSEYFMWGRDAAGGFLYPVVTTDDICVGGSAVPTGKWFQDGDLVLGANAMVGTEKLRVVGDAAVEGGAVLTEQATTPGGDPGAGKGTVWVKNDAPNRVYFTDDANASHRLANYFADPVDIYVSKAGSVTGDGSAEAPFLTIQAAVDAVGLLVPAPTTYDQAIIHVGPGMWDENVIIDIEGVSLVGAGRDATQIIPSVGHGITWTNATRASLAAYDISGNYADLVNNGATLTTGNATSLTVTITEDNKHAFRCIGVKGDDGVSKTYFASWSLTIADCSSWQGGGTSKGLYARNTGAIWLVNPVLFSDIELVNSSADVWASGVNAHFSLTYNPADPAGGTHWGNNSIRMSGGQWGILTLVNEATANIAVCRIDDAVLTDTAGLVASNCVIDAVNADDSSSIQFDDCFVETATDFEGGVTATCRGCTFAGNVGAAAGAGVVTFNGCHVIGVTTDASSKIIYNSGHFKDALQIYVSKSGFEHGDGSAEAPFLTVQEAVDYAEANGAEVFVNDFVINIGSGLYDENVIIQKSGVNLWASDPTSTSIYCTAGVALTYYNGDPADLPAYRAGGPYSGLSPKAPAERGPWSNYVTNLYVGTMDTSYAVECLGVKGDAGGGAKTGFGGIVFKNCALYSDLGAQGLYSRNSQINSYLGGQVGGVVSYNNRGSSYREAVRVSADVEANVVAADPDGTFDGAYFGELSYGGVFEQGFTLLTDTDLVTYGGTLASSITASGTSSITLRDTLVGANVDLDGTGSSNIYGGTVLGNLDCEGGVALVLDGTAIVGTTVLAAGAGAVVEKDCTFAGLITDASDKLSHAGEDRYGTYTEAAGAGARAITFVPNFPNGATINVQISFEGAAVTTFKISDGTIAHTGFTLDTGGNGKFHWYAHKVK